MEGMDLVLNSIDTVKNDCTCPVCSDWYKNPVILSKCCHIICSEHYTSLRNCPTCGTSLEDSTTYPDKRMAACVEHIKKLDEMFQKFKPANPVVEGTKNSSPAKSAKVTTPSSSSKGAAEGVSPKISTPGKNVNRTLDTSSSTKKPVEKRNRKGETLLHIACRLGKVDAITKHLNQGHNPNTKDNAGWTPLHEVVQSGRLDLVSMLLKHNTFVDVPGPSNETPLHEAVRYGHSEIASELVKHGADIHARNSKGETPLQLSSEELKTKLLDVSQAITIQSNINQISALQSNDTEDIGIYCISKNRLVLNKLKILSKAHNVRVETKWTKNVTHLIVDAEAGICASSLDVLQGIASCVWILTSDWAIESTENHLEPFEKHEVAGVGPKAHSGPRTARWNKHKLLPGLFNGCHFYLHNFNAEYEISKNIILTKSVLTKLITTAGGIVLRRVPNPEAVPEAEKVVPYHAKAGGKLANCSHYILYKDMYEPMYNMEHLKALPVGWLIDCIENYELCGSW